MALVHSKKLSLPGGDLSDGFLETMVLLLAYPPRIGFAKMKMGSRPFQEAEETTYKET